MERSYVEKEVLVYTCDCGWVDTGHANPKSYSFGSGAQSLWDQITSQTGTASKIEDGFKVVYEQSMSGGGITAKAGGEFFVARNLTRQLQESVALGIFLQVSYQFEQLQGSFPFNIVGRVAASSFSIEDVVSNVLGFYQVVRGTDWRKMCSVVSKQAALKVYDTYKDQINSTKIATPSPVFFDCSECKKKPSFPSVFKSIDVLSPRMKNHSINYAFQRGAKSREWLPLDRGIGRGRFG